jgi:hypothetical protein
VSEQLIDNDEEVTLALDRVVAYALVHGLRWFAGAARMRDEKGIEHKSLVVWRVPNDEFDAQVRAAAGDGVAVVFEDAAHSERELEEVRQRAGTLMGTDIPDGAISSLRPDGAAITLSVPGDVERWQRVMDEHFPGYVQVAEGHAFPA